jgi:Transposase DDE domain
MGKDSYKVRNWPRYNNGLKQRGTLTIWLPRSLIGQWYYSGKQKRGGQKRYSDRAIEVCLVVRQVYHLALRQTQGFIQSFFKQLRLALRVPDYTVICRRSATLSIAVRPKHRRITDVVMDSTGLKVYGAGEWIQKRTGLRQERTWRKLHVALDESSQQVHAVALTTNSGGAAEVARALLPAIKTSIRSFKGDGAYDKHPLRRRLYQHGILQLIPPHHAAAVRADKGPYLSERNADVAFIKKQGKQQWKVLTHYHQRSKAETFMYRYKTIIGENLKARKLASQQTEAAISCKILNQMLILAKPKACKAG